MTETAIMSFLGSAGISAIGYLFAYIVLKQKFKQDDIISSEIKELCNSIKDLINSIADFKAVQSTHFEIEKLLNDEQKVNYAKISHKIELQNEKIDKIHTLCIKIYGQSEGVPLGQLAVTKGFMTNEQLSECLELQMSSKNNSI